jgi:hypothetical protein
MPVNLPRYWGIVIQGFSPCWDSTDAKVERGILRLKKSNGDRYFLERIAGNMLQIYKNINNTALVSYSDRVTTIFEKNKVVNFFVAQTSSQLIVKYLKNNDLIGTMIQNEATISLGIYDLYMLCIETLGYEADAYFSRTKLIDDALS